jgi:DNA mismatch repair protein MutS2
VNAFASKTARDLQWPELLARVARHAVNPAAADEILQLVPQPDVARAAAAQARAGEALALVARGAALPIAATPEIAELCNLLERGVAGAGEQFRDANRVIDQARRLADHTLQHAELCGLLRQDLWCEPQLDGLRDRIARAIDTSGAVLDSASEGLRAARRALGRIREQLHEASNQLLSRHKDALSGQYLAERGGRFVLPVKAEAQSHVPGMILGSSGSGVTLYVEPRELSELNNRVYVAEAEALREEAKVLAELSASAQTLAPALRKAASNCIAADRWAAIARWADLGECWPVVFASTHADSTQPDSPKLELVRMRHPLLLESTPVDGEPGSTEVVANDLSLCAGQCLMISGPNAGGKTVALKCLGLAVWLAQSGLPVPCAPKSTIGWFDQVLTDIGDEQSISRSLSTFSGHVTRLADYLAAANQRTLILLDEIAGGTDPDEGSALAVSVLGAFVERGAAVATTTHYERLKRLGAGEAQHFVNASVGFDFETMRPTFRLSLGVPGQSSALAVAERFGIPHALVQKALELLPREQQHQRELLEKLESERAQLSALRRQAEAEQQQQLRLGEKLRHEVEHARDRERERLQREAAALTLEVQEARALIARAKSELRAGALLADVAQAERLVNEAATPITLHGNLTQALSNEPGGEQIAEELLVPGLRVYVPHLESEGELVSQPSKGIVRVSVGGLKMSIPAERLRLPRPVKPGARGAAKPEPRRRSKASATHETSSLLPVRTTSNTCDLRGMRVEAGLDTVDSFIDRMLQLGEPAAFILHGHGTGAMKDAVRKHLSDRRQVTRWEPASREDGGDALTVCWL